MNFHGRSKNNFFLFSEMKISEKRFRGYFFLNSENDLLNVNVVRGFIDFFSPIFFKTS